jgi:multisubunit Na+/H+ antiporter MnhE subunit
VSRRVDEFIIRLLITIATAILWLALSILFDMSREQTLVSGAVVGAILLLLFVGAVVSEISDRRNLGIRAVKRALRRRRRKG